MWGLMDYSTKGHAKAKILSDPLLAGEFILTKARKNEIGNKVTPKRGRPSETILMTVRGF